METSGNREFNACIKELRQEFNTRLTGLEVENKILKDECRDLKIKVLELQLEREKNEKNILLINRKLSESKMRNEYAENKISILLEEKENAKQSRSDGRKEHNEYRFDQLKQELMQLETFVKTLSPVSDFGAVAFAAELNRTVGPNADHSIIPYGREMLNIGKAYSTACYTFTAKQKGLYFFSWTVIVTPGCHPCNYLALNGEPVAGYSAYGPDHYTSGSCQVALLVLNPDDQVNIRLGDFSTCQAMFNTSYVAYRSASFKGFLIRSIS